MQSGSPRTPIGKGAREKGGDSRHHSGTNSHPFSCLPSSWTSLRTSISPVRKRQKGGTLKAKGGVDGGGAKDVDRASATGIRKIDIPVIKGSAQNSHVEVFEFSTEINHHAD